jgi:PIN domain nuclease of toxin-antitoxin system
VRGVIANAEGVWFSKASIWELGLKWRKDKIAVQPWCLADQAFADGLRPLPIQLVSPSNMGVSHEKN